MNTTDHAKATDPSHLMALFAERLAAGDADALADLYEPDAVLEPRIGVLLRGREQVVLALRELAAMSPRIVYAGDSDVVIVDDIALVSNTWVMTADLPDGTVHQEGGISADVLRRQHDGTWSVLIDQPRGATVVP